MASVLTTLLTNMKTNVVDSTRHASLTANRKVFVSPAFVPLGLPGDYIEIYPGRKKVSWGDHLEEEQEIIIALVKRMQRSIKNEEMLTDTTYGADTVLELIVKALTRDQPYNDGIHITGVTGYTTLANVMALYPTEYRECEWVQIMETEGTNLGDFVLVYRAVMTAVIEKDN